LIVFPAWANARLALTRFLARLVKKQYRNKTLEFYLFVLALQAPIQHQITTVLIVWQIAKHALTLLHAILASQHLLRRWRGNFQIVIVQLITSVNLILTAYLTVLLPVRHAPIRSLVTLVKKLYHNKTIEFYPFALALMALIQLQIITVLIVWLIAQLALAIHPAILANQLHHRRWQEFFQVVIALSIMLVNQILIVFPAWVNARLAPIRSLATLVKKQFLSKTLELQIYALALQALIQLQTMIVRIVWLTVKLVLIHHPAIHVNLQHLRQWEEYFQLVIAQLITSANLILTVYLTVWINARLAPIWSLVTLVKRQFLSKTLELQIYAPALQALIQLQTMTVRIV
jgi:hypothetical protein